MSKWRKYSIWHFFQKFDFVMEHPVFYATTVFRARGCIRLLRIRDLRYGRTLSGSKNLKSGRKKHPSPSTRPQPQKRATFLIEAAAAASINLLLLLLLGICHLGSYNNIFLANYAYVYYNEGSYPFFSHNTIWMCTVWWRSKRWSNKTINCEERFVKGNHFLNIGVLTTINPFIRIPRCRWIIFIYI